MKGYRTILLPYYTYESFFICAKVLVWQFDKSQSRNDSIFLQLGQGVINDKVKLFRAKWHFSTWHFSSGGSGIKIREGRVMKFVCREWQMSPTMSPSKSDKNQPSKYIILELGCFSRRTVGLSNLPRLRSRLLSRRDTQLWYSWDFCGNENRFFYLIGEFVWKLVLINEFCILFCINYVK